jgi:hypothetical protein
MAKLEDKLAVLATMSLAQLRGEWLQLFRTPAPDGVAHRLLALGIAWRLQEKAQGGLSQASTRELDRLDRQLARTGDLGAEPTAALKVGTRLVREWGGATHQVELMDDGYVYGGERYGSLSQIAHKITGAKWSGPRFFGLNRRTAPVGGDLHG